MPGCPYFIANTFAHLLGGLFITGISTENPIVKDVKNKPITHFGFIIAVLVLLYVTTNFDVGPTKYALFVLLCVFVGQTLVAFVDRLEQKQILTPTLLTVGSIFSTMTVIGLIDNQNMLSWGVYLGAALIVLLITMLLSALFISDKKTQNSAQLWISRAMVVLFTFYIGFDVEILKENANLCMGNPDYINESINLYLDIINLFSGAGGAQD
jgi:FtsH-binding integral membrane protein